MMKKKNFRLKAIIKEEIVSIPFLAFGLEFELSAFRIRYLDKYFECLSLHKGNLSRPNKNSIHVRIHSGCITNEVFGYMVCDCAWQLKHALRIICQQRKGILIYMPWQEGRGSGLLKKMKSLDLMKAGKTTFEAFEAMDINQDCRDYTPALAILSRFGLSNIRLITNNPLKIAAIEAGGFNVVEIVPTIMETDDPNILEYLNSKKKQFHHLIERK